EFLLPDLTGSGGIWRVYWVNPAGPTRLEAPCVTSEKDSSPCRKEGDQCIQQTKNSSWSQRRTGIRMPSTLPTIRALMDLISTRSVLLSIWQSFAQISWQEKASRSASMLRVDEKPLGLTVAECAVEMRVSKNTVYRLIQRGELPSV